MFKYIGRDGTDFKILDTDDGMVESLSGIQCYNLLSSGTYVGNMSFNEDSDIVDDSDIILWKSGKQKDKNYNLTKAKKARKDEFYTQLSDIEAELDNYTDVFKDKVIYCPMDVATMYGSIHRSEFVHYFQLNADKLQFKELIATCLKEKSNGVDCPDSRSNNYHLVRNEVLNYEEHFYPDCASDEGFVESIAEQCEELGIYGSGDFRSKVCIEYLKKCDIVVTNPHFSGFSEVLSLIVSYNKKFLLLGNQNAVTYRDVFPLIRDNKLWYGVSIHSGDREFTVPDDYPMEASGCRIDKNGTKYIRVKGVRWFTNIDVTERHKPLELTQSYYEDPNEYPEYDNYNAINVDKTKDIPKDYYGCIGVPITFLDKYNPDQFEILGCSCQYGEPVGYHYDGKSYDASIEIDGEKIQVYKRLFIKRKDKG